MTLRRALLFAASIVLSAVFVAMLAKIGSVDFRVLVNGLKNISWIAFAKLVFLNVALVLVSTQKWRQIDDVLRSASDSTPSWLKCFVLTSVGLSLGTVLPVQLAMSTARSFGIYVDGRPIQRGTLGTLYEQSFDVLIAIFLAGASAATWFFKGGAFTWSVAAFSMTALAVASAAPLSNLARRVGVRVVKMGKHASLVQSTSWFWNLPLFNSRLARRLMFLSAVRWFVLVLMSTQTANAMNLRIPVWQMGAAVPLVVLASIIAVTPGGIGVNELTSVSVLKVFGTPLVVGAQWALAHRILVVCSYSFVAVCASAVLLFEKIAHRGSHQSNAPAANVNSKGLNREVRSES